MGVSEPEGELQHAERTALQSSLHEAEQSTLAEFDVVRRALRCGVKATIEGDAALADDVTMLAGELERRYGEVHDRLLALIACQAPVAGDLRLAIALLHVNDRIERMGAQCENIAKLCFAMRTAARPSGAQLECLAAMGELADRQVAEAAKVLAERDQEGARRIREHDLAINSANRRCFELAVRDGGDEARREVAFFVALMARALERIGDNAVDVAQQAAFAVTGRLRAAPTP